VIANISSARGAAIEIVALLSRSGWRSGWRIA